MVVTFNFYEIWYRWKNIEHTLILEQYTGMFQFLISRFFEVIRDEIKNAIKHATEIYGEIDISIERRGV